MAPNEPYRVDFPFLQVVIAWIEHHCIIPDGFRKHEAFILYDWQLWITANHYRVKPNAEVYDDDGYPTRAAAFHYRRSQVVAPQKSGKGPFTAAICCAEALGPVLFAGWAREGDVYLCRDNGCSCGWGYPYSPGEPTGMRWPTPLIQLLATSEDQVNNVYRPLQSMARSQHLSEQMFVREGFIRLPNDGRIDAVTSSANSRLGNPTTFGAQDETQLYTVTNKMVKTAETQRRGIAGMGGRSMETTNCWDPAENSTAQRTHSSEKTDIFRFYEPPPVAWSFGDRRERHRILASNYAGSPHVPLTVIEAEAAEIMELDPAQAERFYGNRIVQGAGAWMPAELWERSQGVMA